MLTAGLVGLGLATVPVVRGGMGDLAGDINASLSGAVVHSQTERDRLMRAFWEARNVQRTSLWGDEYRLTYEEHEEHHAYSDADLMTRLQSYRGQEQFFDTRQAAIDAYIASGNDPSLLANICIAEGMSGEDAALRAQLMLANYDNDGNLRYEQARLNKQRVRLEYYEAEARQRGLA